MYNPFDESSQFPGAGSFQKPWSWFTARFAGAARLLLAHRWMAGVPVALFSLHSLMALPVLVIQNGAMASHFRNVGGINWAGEVFAEFIPKWLGSSLRLALSDMSLGVLAPYVQHFLPSLLVLFFVGPMLKWLIEQSGSLEDRALTALRLAWRAAQAILLLLVVVAMGAIASSRMLKAFLQGAPQALHGAAVLVQTAGGALYLAALGIVVRREPLSLGRLLNAAVSCYLELLPIIVLLYLFSNPVPDMVVRLAIRSPFPAARTLSMAIWTLPYAIPLIMIPLVLISAAFATKPQDLVGALELAVGKLTNQRGEGLALVLTGFLLVFLMALITNLRNYLFTGWFGLVGWMGDSVAGVLRFGVLAWVFTAWVAWFADALPKNALSVPVLSTEEVVPVDKKPQMTILVCSDCGANVEPDSNFCDQCGTPLG